MGGDSHILQGIASFRLKADAYTPLELQAAIAGEIEELDPEHIGRIINICFSQGHDERAVSIAEGIICFPGIIGRGDDEKVAMAVGALSMFAATDWYGDRARGSQAGRSSILRLLDHPDPSVVNAVISNLSHGADFELFKRISAFMISDDTALRLAARRYAEVQTSELAFTQEDRGMLAGSTIEFLKKEATALKSIQAAAINKGDSRMEKRLKLMISLIYNHVLKGLKLVAEMTWEEKDLGRYYGTHGFLAARLAPQTYGVLFRKLDNGRKDHYIDERVELRVRLCVVEALERMGSNEALRPAIGSFLRGYSESAEKKELKEASKRAASNLDSNVSRFRLSRPPPRTSIVPGMTIPPKIKA